MWIVISNHLVLTERECVCRLGLFRSTCEARGPPANSGDTEEQQGRLSRNPPTARGVILSHHYGDRHRHRTPYDGQGLLTIPEWLWPFLLFRSPIAMRSIMPIYYRLLWGECCGTAINLDIYLILHESRFVWHEKDLDWIRIILISFLYVTHSITSITLFRFYTIQIILMLFYVWKLVCLYVFNGNCYKICILLYK